MKKIFLVMIIFFYIFGWAEKSDAAIQSLKISSNGHFIMKEDGSEFFWLGDTAWHLPSLDPSEVTDYMKNRASLGYNVIQVTADNFNLDQSNRMPNYRGNLPFTGSMPYNSLNINEAYWQHIDYIVDEAAKNNLYVMLVSAWGSGLNTNAWTDPYNLVYSYGQFLGNRYKNKSNVIFCAAGEFYSIMGSYSAPVDQNKINWLRRIGQGIYSTKGLNQLITIHGNGGNIIIEPSYHFMNDAWLDFYGNQCGNKPEYIDNQINRDYLLTNPTKPTVNLETAYEDCYGGSFTCTPWGQRFMAYWSVFYGGFGHTYGHDRLAAMSGPSTEPWSNRNGGILDPAALNDTGSGQMRYLRNLIESIQNSSRVPDQSIITSSTGIDTGTSPNKIVATRDSNNQWAFIYLTQGGSVTINMAKIASTKVSAKWYDPRSGTYSNIGVYDDTGTRQFIASSSGVNNDWVLVLEGNSPPASPTGVTVR